MPKVNPEILKWARETAGLSLTEASVKLGISDSSEMLAVDRLSALEDGAKEPSRSMLLKMVKQYRRSLLTFYMSAPPKKGDRGQDFRTLPAWYSKIDNALVDALLREIKVRQGLLKSTLEDEDEVEPLSFVGSVSMSDGVSCIVDSIQRCLGITRDEFRAKSSPNEAFNLLRERAGKAGIFVLLISNLGSHHSSIDLECFRGFTLSDDKAPFVVINDQDSASAWSFTLLHELSHLWLGQTGISNPNSENKIERFCDDVAGEFLLPNKEIGQFVIDNTADFTTISELINRYAFKRNVSSSMVAYKLYRIGRIDHAAWSKLSETFRNLWLNNRAKKRMEQKEDKKGGPNYFVIRQHRIGKALINIVGRMAASGALTTIKAGRVLGVKGQNVQALFNTVRGL